MALSIPLPLLRRRAVLSAGLHGVVAAAAYGSAFALRFDFALPPVAARGFLQTLPLLVAVRVACVLGLQVHRGSWRHVGLRDLGRLGVAAVLGSVAFVALLLVTGLGAGMSRAVLAIELLAFVVLAGGMRVAVRWHRETSARRGRTTRHRVVVLGAGQAGERFIRQLQHDAGADATIVAILDDAPHLKGLALHGIPVLGSCESLPQVARERGVTRAVAAIPSATGEQMRRLVTLASAAGLELKVVASAHELTDARDADRTPMRDVRVEDLLGRHPVHLDLGRVERDLAGRTVLVTGGAGSIGSELARQIAGFGPQRLLVFDRAESPLYFVHLELARAYPGVDVVPVIGDITDAARLDDVFATYAPDHVFHAAAYKHVPMCEAHPLEAVRNNVLGTLLVAEAAARHHVTRFVLISTDKAVNPSSLMGATKRIAERIVLHWPALRASSTDFRAVRFGNVLGSDGSVVPLFRRQLAAGGPLTVTHPDVTRYFMSIPEAVQLVLQAATLPDAAGRIAMLEMGEPVRIVDLAEQLIRLSGLVPYRDVDITFTGLRPGEKLYEELIGDGEATVPTSVEMVRLVRSDAVEDEDVSLAVDRVLAALTTGASDEVRQAVRDAVREYLPAVHDREVPAGAGVAALGDGAPVDLRFPTPAYVPALTAASARAPRVAPLLS